MYLEFTTKQLKEFDKLVSIVESCTNPDQHSVATHVLKNWGHMCDRRSKLLKKRGIISMFKFQFKPYKEYRKYVIATNEQVEYLIEYSNMWLEQFEAWVNEQQQVEAEAKAKERTQVVGFSKLLPKKRKK